jgi:orotidine-5'-phosphate decarboxylase
MPELKHLLIAGSLTPEQVALARKAFDGVWAVIAHLYVGKEAVALGRTRLATMVLAVISEGRTDAADIQQASLTLMEKVEAPVPLERGRKRKS